MNKPNTATLAPQQKEQSTSTNLLSYLGILLQLGLLAAVIHIFQIEADLGLTEFWPLLCGAFCIHALAPLRYRPIIFFASFVATLAFFLGEANALKVMLMGLSLFGLCHLPISLGIRKALVLIAGLLLAAMTIGLIASPISSYQMRILTTLFMFRIILYLYELKYEKKKASIWQRLNYFFLLPNIIMPLFPIVDYQGFQKTYFNQKDTVIYQRGVDLILWSIICLLIYRGLYHFGIPSMAEVHGLEGVMHYIIATYLTVIRLVGLLSLSVGILRLFGYNLSDIFNYMFFASSFADLFRRINIYWKDFLMKVCYYPAYFRLRKIAPAYALTLATMVTFFFTWFFHLFQWFWVLGSNPFRDTSVIYWGIFGVIATINTLFEGKKKKGKPTYNLTFVALHTAKVISTFLFMALLYSVWVSPGFDKWIAMIILALSDDAAAWVQVGLQTFALWMLGTAAYYLYLNKWAAQNKTSISTAALRYLGLILMGGMAFTASTQQGKQEQFALFVNNESLNEKDKNEQFTGYYNEILKGKDIASQHWGRGFKNTKKKDLFIDLDIVKAADNVMLNDFIPNSEGLFKGKKMTINRWGFRDQDYEKIPPPNTIRIAIVGSSPAMGTGVEDSEVFERLTEQRLNKNFGSDSLNFELLNFAQSSICTYHFVYQLENKIRHFQPDYLLTIEHCRSFSGFAKKMERILEADVPLYAGLDSIVQAKNITLKSIRSESEKEKKGKLLADWGYQELRRLCKKYAIDPIWVFLPSPNKDNFLDDYLQIVQAAGYDDIISMEDIYQNYNQHLLQVSVEDKHPNAQAHQIISERLYDEMVEYLELK